MTISAEDRPDYWAYFSYSHEDEKAAVSLHRRLERFRIPRHLRGRQFGRLVANKSLQPVFRDRDELSSSGSLSESLGIALKHSHSLVVLCSPAAAKSHWVNVEIEQFVELHGPRRIYPLILKGTPGSNDDLECFPPALKKDGLEPIAGDLQKSGDGSNDALLRVVAGILEVPFDELKRRETRRRQRRLVGITALAATIAISTSILATFAMQQRSQAIEQRQLAELRRGQAEDLITFMLGDLRERLESLGRLDVLEAVGDKATTYFESLPPSELTDQTLASQANALRQIAELRIQQGRYPEAQVAFRVALAQVNELQQRNPDSTDFLFDLSQAQYWVGYSHFLSRDYPAAETYFRQYQLSTAALVEAVPDNSAFRMELAYAYSNLGTVAHDMHETEKALAAFSECRDIFAALYEENPDDLDVLFEVAATDSWLGRVHKTRYELRDALGYYEQSAALHADVSARTGHFFHRQMEAESRSNLSSVRFDLGNTGGALLDEQVSTGIYRELVQHDEQNLGWKLRSLLHEAQEHWLGYLIDPNGGQLQRIVSVLDDAEAIVSSDPANRNWQKIAFQIALDTIALAFLNEDFAQADELLNRYSTDNALLTNPRSADRDAIQDFLRFRIARSVQLYFSGEPAAAAGVARDTLALFDDYPGVIGQHLDNVAILHHAGNDVAAASAIEEKLRAKGFSSEAYRRVLELLESVTTR